MVSPLRRATADGRLSRRDVSRQLVSLANMIHVIRKAVVDHCPGLGVPPPDRLRGNICHHACRNQRRQHPVETPEAFCARNQSPSVLNCVVDQARPCDGLRRIEKPVTVKCGCCKVEEGRQCITRGGAEGDSDCPVRQLGS